MPSLSNQIAAQGFPAISAQSLQPLSIKTISSPWTVLGDSDSSHEFLRKYEVYESDESLLTLSVTAKRMFEQSRAFFSLTQKELYQWVTYEDRVLAEQIQNYYSKRVMMWKLQKDSLTRFREDMNKLIHTDMKVFKENNIGIAYWLPYFYEYDLKMDNIKLNFVKDQSFKKMDNKGAPNFLKITETLIPIERIERKTKRNKKMQYWFKDTEHNAGVLIEVLEKNQLQHIWDRLFDKKEPMIIKGLYVRRKYDDFEYYSITNWTLE